MADESGNIAADVVTSPDWNSISEEIACPLCGYNLRGLGASRCPECGYTFHWPDLLDPSRRKHPYLFELKPKNNFKSFWKTAFHGLRPIKFWSALRPNHQCVPRRMGIYWMVVSAVVMLAFASEYLIWALREYLEYRAIVNSSSSAIPTPVFAGTGGLISWTMAAFRWPRPGLEEFIIPVAIVFAWPWITYLALSVFAISMRRAKIRTVHVVRCIVYSWDLVLWAAIITLATSGIVAGAMALEFHLNSTGNWFNTWAFGESVVAWVWIVMAVAFVYRLTAAYWCYLRFDHPFWTVVASQIITLLAVSAVVFYACWALESS